MVAEMASHFSLFQRAVEECLFHLTLPFPVETLVLLEAFSRLPGPKLDGSEIKMGNPSVAGGDRASMVLSEPLNGGSPEVRVTGSGQLQNDLRPIRISGV